MTSPSIPKRYLGMNGHLVPRTGYGAIGLGKPVYGRTFDHEDAPRLALLEKAYEIGCTF